MDEFTHIIVPKVVYVDEVPTSLTAPTAPTLPTEATTIDQQLINSCELQQISTTSQQNAIYDQLEPRPNESFAQHPEINRMFVRFDDIDPGVYNAIPDDSAICAKSVKAAVERFTAQIEELKARIVAAEALPASSLEASNNQETYLNAIEELSRVTNSRNELSREYSELESEYNNIRFVNKMISESNESLIQLNNIQCSKIDEYKRELDALKKQQLASTLAVRAELQTNNTQQLETIREQFSIVNAELAESNAALTAVVRENSTLREQLQSQAENAASEAATLNEQIRHIKDQLATTNTQLTTANEQLVKLEATNALANDEIHSYIMEVKDLERDYDELMDDLTDCQDKQISMEETIETNASEIHNLRECNNYLQEVLDDERNMRDTQSSHIDELTSQLDNSKLLAAELKSQNTSLLAKIALMEDSINKLSISKTVIASNLNHVTNVSRSAINSANDNLSRANEQNVVLTSEITDLRTEITALRTEITALRTEIAKYMEENDNQRVIIENNGIQLSSLNEQLEACRKQYKYTDELYNSTSAENDDMRSRLIELSGSYDTLCNIIVDSEAQKTMIDTLTARVAAMSDELTTLITSSTTLTAENDRLTAEITKSAKENNRLVAENAANAVDIRDLCKTANEHATGIVVLEEGIRTLSTKCDKLSAQLCEQNVTIESLGGENADLTRENTNLKSQTRINDDLIGELYALTNALERERDELKEQIARTMSENNIIVERNANYGNDLRALSNKVSQLSLELNDATVNKRMFEKKHKDSAGVIMSLTDKLRIADKRISELNHEIRRITSHRTSTCIHRTGAAKAL